MMMRPVVDGQRANEAKISSSQEKGAKPSSFYLKAARLLQMYVYGFTSLKVLYWLGLINCLLILKVAKLIW